MIMGFSVCCPYERCAKACNQSLWSYRNEGRPWPIKSHPRGFALTSTNESRRLLQMLTTWLTSQHKLLQIFSKIIVCGRKSGIRPGGWQVDLLKNQTWWSRHTSAGLKSLLIVNDYRIHPALFLQPSGGDGWYRRRSLPFTENTRLYFCLKPSRN